MHWSSMLALAAALLAPLSAAAWSRPGHMVAAAIAYDELKRRDPAALALIVKLAAAHPDRGAFEVAVGRAEGEEADRRRFLELARWPDDARGTLHDHPTWHYRLRPIVEGGVAVPDGESGAGVEALALAIRVAGDPRAAPAERATALAWILHIAADLHQPLHAAERFGPDWPQGDQAGSKVFVREAERGKPVSLHWLWDDAVSRDGTPEAAFARATALTARFPRAGFERELRTTDARGWLRESYALAQGLAYRADAPRATRPEAALVATPSYRAELERAAAERLTLSGYRLSDLLTYIIRQ
ncbi:S1/P1 nuclease [Sphingomonas sp. DT-207]|uniref:S1/P1 nuclease n=1 Tax=Sphingomonas sp. DT-207 TaxID=3396167 RepID=UPI003F19EFE0